MTSLLQILPATLRANRLATTCGGSTKTTKEKTTLDLNLASASAHWLAFRYICCIRLLGIVLNRLLQSDNKSSIIGHGLSLDNIWITLKASSSTIKLESPKSLKMMRPSLRAHNSAMKLLVVPKARLKPLIQWPRWSRITPPPPALPGFPKAEPSVLNFTHPTYLFHMVYFTFSIYKILGKEKKVTFYKHNDSIWLFV